MEWDVRVGQKCDGKKRHERNLCSLRYECVDVDAERASSVNDTVVIPPADWVGFAAM